MTEQSEKRPRIFYGWWIITVVAIIAAYASGVIFYGFTAILEPLSNEFGWSYAQISFAASLRGFNSGLLSPLIGYLLDRWGPRKLVFAGSFLLGLGLVLLGQINSLIAFYLVFVLISIGSCTSGPIVVMTVAANWFRRKVSTATGIAMGIGSAGGLLVPLVTWVIDTYDWKMAMLIIGVCGWVIIMPLSLFIRHKPEQYGYLPDGDTRPVTLSPEALASLQETEVNVGVGQALKSRAFWHTSVGFTCHVMVILAVTTHIMPYLTSIGISRSASSLVASSIALVSILGNISFGWLGDRYSKVRLTAFGIALSTISMFLLVFVVNAGTWLLVPFVIIFGIGFGGPVPMTSSVLREYFGRARLGTVLGLTLGVMMVGSVISPPLAGWFYDHYGSYQEIWYIYIGVLIIGIISFLTAPSVRETAGTAVRATKTR